MFSRNKQLLSKADQVVFLKELAELGQAGYSLNQSLGILVDAHHSWQFKLKAVQEELASGVTISDSLGPLFDPGIRIYLHLAQEQGRFSQTVQHLADKMQLMMDYQRQLKAALTYPALLLVVLFAMVYGLETTLYPVFSTLTGALGHGEGNVALFALHLILGLVLFLSGFGCLVYVVLMNKRPLKRCRLLSNIPFLSSLSKTLISGLVAEQLALLLAAGLTLPAIVSTFCQKEKGKTSLALELAEDLKRYLDRGEDVSSWVGKQSFLNPTLGAYLSRGFESTLLATYLSYFAKHEFMSFDRRIKRVFSWIQPILFTVVGVAIVLLYLAMLLPLYQNLGGLPT
ncbi:type II secretion system F family protein [Fructobacillus sp. W13]|uniref:Type II secretion system F family protein n=1 Tax=Fructobacillus apis TaxID=2935017 RepID=A0ABT0ZP93_9LACO|nr:type II secretion system F family protein [Fructobacillus apis]MCO0831815.1 type II secretion system F family protein [Fructobacillus apis]